MPETVDEATKTVRIMELQALQRRIQSELHGQAVGMIDDVLVDSVSRKRSAELSGRTGGNTVVNFPGSPEWLGRTARIRITRAGPNSLSGEAVRVLPA